MTSTSSLAGKRALITGGSRGIGAAIVRRLASQGATVAVNYRSDRAAADALVGELRDNGCAASAFPADVSDAAQTHELVGAVVSEFGGLDLPVSNAGVEHFGALETIAQADFDRLFQTNVAGQLFVTQAAVAAMTDGGRINLPKSPPWSRFCSPQTRLISPAPPSKPTAAGANSLMTVGTTSIFTTRPQMRRPEAAGPCAPGPLGRCGLARYGGLPHRLEIG